MENEKLPNENATNRDSEEKMKRREAAGRIGKFLAYTAPALLAMATAKNACAN